MTDQETLRIFCQNAISTIANNSTLTDLARLTYDTFNIAITIVDVGYQLLAHATPTPCIDPLWQTIIEHGYASETTIVDFFLKEGMLDTISHANGSIVVDWGACADYPQSSGPIYIDNTLEGFVNLLFLDESKRDFALELNTILCQLSAIIMRNQNTSVHNRRIPVRDVLAQKIFSKNDGPDSNFGNELFNTYRNYVDIEPGFLIAVLAYDTPESNTIEHVRGRVQALFSNILFLQREKNLYVLMHHIGRKKLEGLRSELNHLISTYQLHCGYSTIFTDIQERRIYIEQAELALSCGMHINPEKRIYFFENYYDEIILMYPVQSLHYENAILSPIRTLYDSDIANGTDYIDTLFAYLTYRNNIRETAEALHLHRNTLNYRLQRISDILDIDINQPYAAAKLQLSIHTLKTIFAHKIPVEKPDITLSLN